MPKRTYPEAIARIYYRMFVCRVCKHKIRTDAIKVKNAETKCRNCGSKALRPKKKPV